MLKPRVGTLASRGALLIFRGICVLVGLAYGLLGSQQKLYALTMAALFLAAVALVSIRKFQPTINEVVRVTILVILFAIVFILSQEVSLHGH